MATRSRDPDRERERDLLARQDAVRRNAAKGVSRNLEEAVLLVRAGERFRAAFQARR